MMGNRFNLGFVEQSHADFRDSIALAVQRQLFDHWDGLRAGAQMPLRRDFRPERLPRSLVPHIGLVKVHLSAAGPAFEYRIIGNAIARTFGTGAVRRHPSDDRPQAYARKLEEFYALSAETHAAVSWAAPNILVGGGESRVQRLCLPLRGEDGRVAALLFSTVGEPDEHGQPPEDYQGRLIADIAPRRPLLVCARRQPLKAAA